MVDKTRSKPVRGQRANTHKKGKKKKVKGKL